MRKSSRIAVQRFAPFLVALLCSLTTLPLQAQVFSKDQWKQRNLMVLKMSELYKEFNVGVNLTPRARTADFVYLAAGYGKPTALNPWRKFLPPVTLPKGKTHDELVDYVLQSTSKLHAFKVGVGWTHYFDHTIGCYAQAGWGTIADFSTELPDEADDTAQEEDKDTFIYNTLPVELGVTVCLWKHITAQAGFTYMWKEIPLLTIGVGLTF